MPKSKQQKLEEQTAYMAKALTTIIKGIFDEELDKPSKKPKGANKKSKK